MNKYPAYKDSGIEWLGCIPAHWKVSKLKYILEYQVGFTPTTTIQDYFEGENTWVTIADLGGKSITESRTKLSDQAIEKYNATIVPAGSLLFSFKLSVGKVAFAGKDLYTNEAIAAFINRDTNAINFFYYSLPIQLLKNANENIYGAKILNQELIKNACLLIPPFHEQNAIANYLDSRTEQIETLISNKQKLIELLKEEQTAIINQAVTKGLDQNVPMKDSGIESLGEIPAHWEVKPLRYVGQCQNGISKSAEYFGSGFPFVSYGNVYKNITLPSYVTGLVESTETDREIFSVREGDVFFTRTSETIEEIGLASTCMSTIENATFAGFLIRFRPAGKTLTKEFSKYYFRSQIHRVYFVKEMNLVTRASLSQGLLKKLPVLLPSLKEQREIAAFLDSKINGINALITKTQQEIDLLKEYKTALISEVVTGKVDVREEILEETCNSF